MTTKTENLIIDFGEQAHPLGRAISAEEVPALIEALRKRLDCTAQELDLSPDSLKRLESRLIRLHQAVEAGKEPMDDEQTVRLMREFTAYLGQVMVANLGGDWAKSGPGLCPAMITIPKPVETIKGKEIHWSSKRAFAAAHNAAYFWDLIGTGQEHGFLWKEYKAMTKRRWRERL